MEYPLKRSCRKTISIVIGKGGEVEVRAPRFASLAQIEAFVESKQEWICRKQAEQRERAAKRADFSLSVGDTALFLGEEFPIRAGSKAAFREGAFWVRTELPVLPQLEQIYRKLARQLLTERTMHFAAGMGVTPTGLRITGASTRYGSCSGKNSLNFTWKLVMAPMEAVDYVVVHELCHIRQHNHSAAFWAEVAAVLPDYREREQVLRRFGKVLSLQNWEYGD